jgi:hypothetical protein
MIIVRFRSQVVRFRTYLCKLSYALTQDLTVKRPNIFNGIIPFQFFFLTLYFLLISSLLLTY